MAIDKKSEFSIEDKKKLVVAAEKIKNSGMSTEEQQVALQKILEGHRQTAAMLDGLPTEERDTFKAGVKHYLSLLIPKMRGRQHIEPDGTVVVEKVGSISQMKKLEIELKRYLNGEHDTSDEESLKERYNELVQKFEDISEAISRLEQSHEKNKESDLSEAKDAWKKLENADKEVEQFLDEIKERNINVKKPKFKLQKAGRTVRRLNKEKVAILLACAYIAAQAGTSFSYWLDGKKNNDAYQDNYIVGETVEDITDGYNGDLERTVRMMTRDELMYKHSDVRDTQNEKAEQEFADMLKVIDEYIVVANKDIRTPEEERRYHELAIIIDDYEGYVDLEGNAIGFKKTMELMAKSKLADAMREEGCEVNDIEKNIQLMVHEATKDTSNYTSLKVKYKDKDGEYQEHIITDDTWIFMANSNFLSSEIVGLTEQLSNMSSNPSVDEKVEHMQVIAGMISTGIVFDAKTGKFTMKSDEEEKTNNAVLSKNIQLESEDGR